MQDWKVPCRVDMCEEAESNSYADDSDAKTVY